MRAGRAEGGPGTPLADGALPVWVSESFAAAHALRPGSRVGALINGKQRDLQVSGIALSPEYIFAGLWGMPDQRGFGVFWVDGEALDAAWDMEGAFNRVAVKLAPGASERGVIDALVRLLAPYGGREAHGRSDQVSHAMLDNEIAEQRVLGTLVPAIFLGVAAFLLNVVVSRLVATQREQIAALKALGYANRAIAAHYLQLVGVIVAIGLRRRGGAGQVAGRGAARPVRRVLPLPAASTTCWRRPWSAVAALAGGGHRAARHAERDRGHGAAGAGRGHAAAGARPLPPDACWSGWASRASAPWRA